MKTWWTCVLTFFSCIRINKLAARRFHGSKKSGNVCWKDTNISWLIKKQALSWLRVKYKLYIFSWLPLQKNIKNCRGCWGHDRHCVVVGFTNTCAVSAYHHRVMSSNPVHGEVYSIQHYMIKFVSDLRHVGGFFRVLWFPSPIKLTAKILLKVALNTINQTKNCTIKLLKCILISKHDKFWGIPS